MAIIVVVLCTYRVELHLILVVASKGVEIIGRVARDGISICDRANIRSKDMLTLPAVILIDRRDFRIICLVGLVIPTRGFLRNCDLMLMNVAYRAATVHDAISGFKVIVFLVIQDTIIRIAFCDW